jgi:hypothetical protein
MELLLLVIYCALHGAVLNNTAQTNARRNTKSVIHWLIIKVCVHIVHSHRHIIEMSTRSVLR